MTRRSSRILMSILATLLVGLVMQSAASAASPTPVFVERWGPWGGSWEGLFSAPGGVATDAVGNVYVADTENNRIQKFDSSGEFIVTWGWGVQDGSAAFQRCTGNCQGGLAGTGSGQLSGPHGVAVSGSGEVFVADTYNSRILKFDSDGNYVSQWGSLGTGINNMDWPFSVATDAVGHVYVADTGNDRILEFDSNGDSVAGWGSTGTANGQFMAPRGIAIDELGDVYVAELGGSRVQKFTSSGSYVTKWGSSGSANGEFSFPVGVTVDASGSVFVVDQGNDRIQKFTSSGSYLTQWGSSGTGNGEFADPYDVATDDTGRIYVADSNNNRIQVFGPPSTSVTIKAPRKVIAGTRVKITGLLGSADNACLDSQKVKLKKGAATLAIKRTSASGGYRFVLRVKRKVRVQVVFDGTLECAASKSSRKTIRVA